MLEEWGLIRTFCSLPVDDNVTFAKCGGVFSSIVLDQAFESKPLGLPVLGTSSANEQLTPMRIRVCPNFDVKYPLHVVQREEGVQGRSGLLSQMEFRCTFYDR